MLGQLISCVSTCFTLFMIIFHYLLYRVLSTLIVAYNAFDASKMIKITIYVYTLILGMLLQWDKIYQLSLFGSATKQLIQATVHGDIQKGQYTIFVLQ